MKKPVVACPDCGAIVEYDWYGNSFKCKECGWFLPGVEFDDVLDKKTLKEIDEFIDDKIHQFEEDYQIYSYNKEEEMVEE